MDDPFTPMPSHGDISALDSGADLPTDAPSRSASDIARQAARAAVRTSSPESTFHDSQRASERPTEPVVEDLAPELDENGLEISSVEEVAQEFEEVEQWSVDDFAHFTERGIDLPIAPEDVPEEFRGHYGRMAQAIEDAYENLRSTEEQRAIAEGRLSSFAERMRTPEGQKRILTTLAMANPELFQEVIQSHERMQSDPEYAQLVRDRMEVEMMREQNQLQQTAMQRSTSKTFAQQVESRTERLAQRLGVDTDLAKEMVVNKILQNKEATGKPGIKLAEVDEVIKTLAKRVGAKPRPRPAKAPTTVQREAQAPTHPTEGAGRDTPGAPSRPSPTRERSSLSLQDSIRNAVRSSSERIRSKGL